MAIPAKPSEDTPQAWAEWADRHYPYSEKFAAEHRTRCSPAPEGSELELNMLRIFRPESRENCGALAWLWFHVNENRKAIELAQTEDRAKAREAEMARLIRLAREALEGTLGHSPQDKKDAQVTAQAYIRKRPEQCSFEELSDWFAMHRYAHAIAHGRNPPRPALHADRVQKREQAKQMADIDDAIGASQGELGW